MSDSFAELLRRYRVAASLTQEGLAERANISAAAVAALEQGLRRQPRLSTVRALADALGLDATERAALAAAASATVAPVAAGPASDGAGGASPRPVPPPQPLGALIGRFAEANVVADDLGNERLLTLVGPGGVGKTRLVLRVAAATTEKFSGGTWWVGLDAVQDPPSLPAAVLAASGVNETPGRPIAEQIAGAVPAEPLLLVLDNCEHLLDPVAELLGPLLATTAITVLATSRETLAIPGEVVRTVEPLALPSTGAENDVDALVEVASVQLFVERAGRARPGFALDEHTAMAVARICRRLDGLPLAIELTAARLRGTTVMQLAEDLEANLALAEAGARGVPERQSTIAASTNWSYELLSGDERAALRSLAAFVGSFSAPAADAVMARSQGDARHLLSGLVNKSLVSAEAAPEGAIRFRLLESTRAYVVDRASAAGELHALRLAHARYYAAWLATLSVESDRDAATIEAEYPNIRTALLWLIDQGDVSAATLVANLGDSWHVSSRFQDAELLGEAALAVTEPLDRAEWARAAGAIALARLLGAGIGFVLSVVPVVVAAAAELGDALTEARGRLVLGCLPPYDDGQLQTAFALGVAAGSANIPALAAAIASVGGASDPDIDWQSKLDDLEPAVEAASVEAVCAMARLGDAVERARLEMAEDVALQWLKRRDVLPALRSTLYGRLTEVALLANDVGLAAHAEEVGQQIMQEWPEVRFWGVAMQTVVLSVLRGIRAPLPSVGEALSARLSMSPLSLRILCRTGIDQDERLDPVELACQNPPVAPGSLMAASIAAVQGAVAMVDGADDVATERWSEALAVASRDGYLLLACDALEAIAVLAGRRELYGNADQLLAAAGALRDKTGYRFRFGFEQNFVDV